MEANQQSGGRSTHQKVGLALGPLIAITMLAIGPPESLDSDIAWRTAAMGLLMATWWATEALPIAVTAFVPLVCFPLLGIANIQETAAPYANKVIYLFVGGFVIALAMQRWNLHKRIALTVLERVGGNGRALVAGFMLASALLSMWVMNTSTTMMLLPIGVSVIKVIHDSISGLDERNRKHFQYALLLGIAYGATIGGMATLVGTAPNAMLAAFMADNYNVTIDFSRWMLVGVPLSITMLPLAWITLVYWVFPVDFKTSGEGKRLLHSMKEAMGPTTIPERRVGWIFLVVCCLWLFRPLLLKFEALAGLDDSGIAMAGAIAMFLVPSGDRDDPFLLRWEKAAELPWGILVLFGGGLALAGAVSQTGLANWIGSSLQAVGTLPIAVLVMLAATLIIFLTELTSNIATTATFLPIVAAVAIGAGADPVYLTVPVTLAASCAFMLPVATPPNAIVFGSGLLTIPNMVRAGIALNLIGIVLVSLVGLYLAPRIF